MDAIEAGTLKAFQDMRAAAQEAAAEIARLRALLRRWLLECDPTTGALVDLFEDTEDALSPP